MSWPDLQPGDLVTAADFAAMRDYVDAHGWLGGTTLTASQFDIRVPVPSGTYRALRLELFARHTGTGIQLARIFVNADLGSSAYSAMARYETGGGTVTRETSTGFIPIPCWDTPVGSAYSLSVPNASNGNRPKVVGSGDLSSVTIPRIVQVAGHYATGAQVNEIRISAPTGQNLAAGSSFHVFGVGRI